MKEHAQKVTRTRFGFIGFGLIGGSIARALRILFPDAQIFAYNYYQTKKHPTLEKAKEDGTLNGICTELSAFSACDVLFLCAPVIKNADYLTKVAPYLSEDCLITDVGSVKGNICEKIRELDLTRQFVGGHPMTGSEKTGYENSSEEFLKDHYYILTPTPDTRPEYLSWMEQFVKAAGSKCMILDPKTHDQVTAGISHVPHVISAALVGTVSGLDEKGYYAKLAAGGFHSVTRISSSSPEMWENICLTNRDCILECLDSFIGHLKAARKEIADGNGEGLTEFFSNAKKYRDHIVQ
ncbi:MAG: prephenate dehydrogenase/arogenate dehydrogenase family protein [Lachnospiraceae bacterium]|nr:prephenate dehydrogenase/arogenate dehydrogenase family protein [Lachnospiraceae bacterium]